MIGDVTYVQDMHARKVLMYRSSDAFIALPGGFGTFGMANTCCGHPYSYNLEELLETITWVQLGIHTKTIGTFVLHG